MKTLIITVALMLPVTAMAASPRVQETEINEECGGGLIMVSTSAWTAVPTTNCPGRTGIFITVASTANASMNGHLWNNSTSTAPITQQDVLFAAGVTQRRHFGSQIYLFMRSLHTASEPVYYREIRQK